MDKVGAAPGVSSAVGDEAVAVVGVGVGLLSSKDVVDDRGEGFLFASWRFASRSCSFTRTCDRFLSSSGFLSGRMTIFDSF